MDTEINLIYWPLRDYNYLKKKIKKDSKDCHHVTHYFAISLKEA